VKTYTDQVNDARKRILAKALERHGWNKTHTAWALKIDRNYLQRLVKQFHLMTPTAGGK
jgi:DNA-binding NtrC family response regulator